MKVIQKSFPADIAAKTVKTTFLNNNKLDGLMYAYFQSLSMPYQIDENVYETRVDKSIIPSQAEAAKKIRIASAKTWRKHLQDLIDSGYIIEKEDYYVLPQVEDVFFLIPLNTLKFMVDTLKDDVIKVYIYLGQRYKYAQSENRLYSFTQKEIRVALGKSDTESNREFIKHALNCLINNGLIRVSAYHEGKVPRLRLVAFNYEYIENLFEGDLEENYLNG